MLWFGASYIRDLTVVWLHHMTILIFFVGTTVDCFDTETGLSEYWCPFYQHGLNLIPAWIHGVNVIHISKGVPGLQTTAWSHYQILQKYFQQSPNSFPVMVWYEVPFLRSNSALSSSIIIANPLEKLQSCTKPSISGWAALQWDTAVLNLTKLLTISVDLEDIITHKM